MNLRRNAEVMASTTLLAEIELIKKKHSKELADHENRKLIETLNEMKSLIENSILEDKNLSQQSINAFNNYLKAFTEFLNIYSECKKHVENKQDKYLTQELKSRYVQAELNLKQAEIAALQAGLKQPFVFEPAFELEKIEAPKKTIAEQIMGGFDTKGLTQHQVDNLKALSKSLADKWEDPKVTKKTQKEVNECIRQTRDIIAAYQSCQDNIAIHNKEVGNKKQAQQAAADIKLLTNGFMKQVKAYENKCAKWNLGQKIFIGACTVVGGLLGAVLGAAAGLAAGAAIGGGVGSVVPLFGNIGGAIAGGNAGAVVGILKGVGIGTQVGMAAAAAIMGIGTAYAAKKASSSSFFMTKQQKLVTELKADMLQEIKADSKDAKKEIELNKKIADLRLEIRGLHGKRPNTAQVKRQEIEKLEKQIETIHTESLIRKAPKPTK